MPKEPTGRPVGRPPKPIEQKRKLGNPGKRALPSPSVALEPVNGTPEIAGEPFEAPGSELWARIWDGGAPWLSRLDMPVAEMLCRSWDDLVKMEARVAKDGDTILEPIVDHGKVVSAKVVVHPLKKEIRQEKVNVRTLASTLGFDPTSRSRLGIAEVKKQTQLEELMAKRAYRSEQRVIEAEVVEDAA